MTGGGRGSEIQYIYSSSIRVYILKSTSIEFEYFPILLLITSTH